MSSKDLEPSIQMLKQLFKTLNIPLNNFLKRFKVQLKQIKAKNFKLVLIIPNPDNLNEDLFISRDWSINPTENQEIYPSLTEVQHSQYINPPIDVQIPSVLNDLEKLHDDIIAVDKIDEVKDEIDLNHIALSPELKDIADNNWKLVKPEKSEENGKKEED